MVASWIATHGPVNGGEMPAYGAPLTKSPSSKLSMRMAGVAQKGSHWHSGSLQSASPSPSSS
ncbi:hypothetical protein BE21_02185 [Sorangium cellulosum]|uniref:Uncharacterized protein n=1 Tax=Sorangium cellulosum TaxID=56 RepID=A0A150TTL6_SORCE|nr:hypothetical protein BE21_02185 [Sorangium cellulosum]